MDVHIAEDGHIVDGGVPQFNAGPLRVRVLQLHGKPILKDRLPDLYAGVNLFPDPGASYDIYFYCGALQERGETL